MRYHKMTDSDLANIKCFKAYFRKVKKQNQLLINENGKKKDKKKQKQKTKKQILKTQKPKPNAPKIYYRYVNTHSSFISMIKYHKFRNRVQDARMNSRCQSLTNKQYLPLV